MSICIGTSDSIKEVKDVYKPIGGTKKEMTDGYLTVDGVRRQFLGMPTGIDHITAGDLVLLGYRYDTASNSWTDRTQVNVGRFPRSYAFGEFGSLSLDSDDCTFTIAANTLHYVYAYFNMFVVFDNGRKVRLDKVYTILDASEDFLFPSTIRANRIIGSGAWSWDYRLFGQSLTSGFGSNTTYNVSITTPQTINAYHVYEFVYDYGGVNGIDMITTIPSMKIDMVAYNVNLFE